MEQKKRKSQKNYFFLFFLPPLVFFFLLAGNLWMWYDNHQLSLNLIRNQTANAIDHLLIQLDILVFERGKDLKHLASIWNNFPQIANSKFLTDAAGIIKREPVYFSISYFDTSGETKLWVSNDSLSQTQSPLSRLDLKKMVQKFKNGEQEEVLPTILSSPVDEQFLVLFIPVFKKADNGLLLSGIIAGTLKIEEFLVKAIRKSVPAGYRVTVMVDSIQIYQSETDESIFEQGEKTAFLRAANSIWRISAAPFFGGLSASLINQNSMRLAINIIASLLVTILLTLLVRATYNSRIIMKSLEDSEKRYRLLTENARDLIYRLSIPDGKYEYVSSAAEKITGYTPQEFYSTPLLIKKILDSQWQDYFERQWSEAIKGRVPPVYEYKIIHKSGEPRWVNQRNVVVYKNDVPVAIEGMVTDITEQKTISQERERLIKELEKKNIDLERFTYTISHELRQPLITIKGFLGYLENDAEKGDRSILHQDIIQIIKATDNMQRLLNDLIDLNRIGRVSKEPEEIEMRDLIKNAVNDYRESIEMRGIRVDISPDMPKIIGFRVELFELFQNLIENAIKFMGDQPLPQIKISSNVSTDESIFVVKDNGVGFDPKYESKIFGLFNKLRPETEGTGVGLALVKRIVEHHGGWIKAESEGPGKGSTISFMLPHVSQG